MGVDSSFYTLLLPSVAALIPILVLWRTYDEAQSDMASRARLEEIVSIPPPPERKTDPRLAYIFEFILLAWIIGLEIAILIALIIYILKRLGVNLPDLPLPRPKPKSEGPQKAVGSHIKPWLIILSVLPLALILYGLIIFMMGRPKLEDLTVPVEISNRVLAASGIAIGFTSIGAGIGMTFNNKAAVKGMLKQPGLSTWYVIISALAEGLALYGLVVAFMIMGKYGALNLADVIVLEAAAVIIALGAIGAGLGIALTMKLSSGEMVDQPFSAIWIMILAALAEGTALYALVISFMMIGKVESVGMEGAMLLWNSVFKFGGGLILSGFLVGYLPFFVGKRFSNQNWILRIIAGAAGGGVALLFLVQEFMIIGKV
jgi:V/A-type H+-transporting ATPase subunit K